MSTGKSVRTELVTTTSAVSKETQTEASCFHHPEEPIQPTALICYEEIPAEKETIPAEKKAPVIVKQEKEPVFLSDFNVRRQILNQVAVTPEICKTCDKPRPVRFDPSKVKVEAAQASGIGKDHEPPSMVCLNPEPLQAMVPLPLPAGNLEPEDHMEFNATDPEDHMEFNVTDPEPLLLTFPAVAYSIPADSNAVAEPDAATEGVSTQNATGVQQVSPCKNQVTALTYFVQG